MPIRRRGSLARRHPDRRVEPPIAGPGAFEDAGPGRARPAAAGVRGPPGQRRRGRGGPADAGPGADADGDPDGWLYGIYDGTPLNTWGADQVPFPNVITLFRVPLQEDFPDPDELAWEIERTVVHELAHHAGIDDARLTELGYD